MEKPYNDHHFNIVHVEFHNDNTIKMKIDFSDLEINFYFKYKGYHYFYSKLSYI